jgi:hypothetical protein
MAASRIHVIGRRLFAPSVVTAMGLLRYENFLLDAPGTAAAQAEIRIPLSAFKEGEVSFTYPDSMISLWFARDKPIEYYQPDYHGQVFTLSEMLAIVELKGLPEEAWETNLPDDLAPYIEAQVWNHKPLLEYKRQLNDGQGSR